MTIWAIGRIGERHRVIVETTEPAHILAQMEPGEDCAPVSRAQAESELGLRLLGSMEIEEIAPEPDTSAGAAS